MMKKIIECIPNFSEGRDKSKIKAIIKAITDVDGVVLLDSESDIDHNRSVVTFAGNPEAVVKAAFEGVKKAAELIDLDKHKGAHPRMGATDVCPLVPLSGVSEAECIKYAEKLAKRIGTELKIPVYLYEKAARRKGKKNLAEIRRGQYEAIKKEIGKNKDRDPDFGPKKLGKAGATAVGVRSPLIAYNVNLQTKNIKIAKAIAKKIRFKDGGFKCVKALGFELKDRGIVQVSMNLTDYKITGINTVFNAITKECEALKIKISESEIIGLIPQEALTDAAEHYLKISNFSSRQILEQVLSEKLNSTKQTNESGLKNFLDEVASKKPVPGGGSVSALAGALAASLLSMVANLTLANKKYAKVHSQISKTLKETEKIRTRLYELIEEDSLAYQAVVEAYKTGKKGLIQRSLKQAATKPLEIAETATLLLPHLKVLQTKGNKNAISDCGVALHMLKTAVLGAILNVEINLKYINDKKFVSRIKKILSSKKFRSIDRLHLIRARR